MHGQRSLWSFLVLLCSAIALTTRNSPPAETFCCTGGSIYFTAHPVDSLLFQNPDLFHDLYVFKCVTTVVFTSGDRGNTVNYSLSLEYGLAGAYSWMAGLPMKEPHWVNALMQITKYQVPAWSLKEMPNIKILYLRLPDGAPTGQGYDANGGQSLAKLYNEEIASITTTDGNATYTLDDLKNLVAAILLYIQPSNIGILDHKASISQSHDTGSDHADHIISAKLVMDVIKNKTIEANIKAYAGDLIRKLEANLNSSHPGFDRKAAAFFKYAEHDEQMCQSLQECERRLGDDEADLFIDSDVKYIAQYLGREYYVS